MAASYVVKALPTFDSGNTSPIEFDFENWFSGSNLLAFRPKYAFVPN